MALVDGPNITISHLGVVADAYDSLGIGDLIDELIPKKDASDEGEGERQSKRKPGDGEVLPLADGDAIQKSGIVVSQEIGFLIRILLACQSFSDPVPT